MQTAESTPARLEDLERRVRMLERCPTALSVIVCSAHADRQIMAFTLATSAAATGVRVSMFFTFWGMLALRKRSGYSGKPLVHKIVTAMLPSSPRKLPVSMMNCGGIGRWFFHYLMKTSNAEPLENLIALAGELGVRMVCCETTLAVMGIRPDELVDGVEYGGAVSCVDSMLEAKSTIVL